MTRTAEVHEQPSCFDDEHNSLIGSSRPWEELVLSPIKAVELEAASLSDVVSLAQGIPSFDTPEEIKNFVIEQIRAGLCARYSLSPGLPPLREQIAEALRRDRMSYDPDSEILVTCGSIEAVSASLLSLLEPGNEVLVVSPSYTSYLSALKLASLEPRFVPLDEDRGFELDLDALAARISPHTRAVLIAQPNNPTGTIFSVDAIRSLLELAERHDLLVLSDEVYKDFVYSDLPVVSPAHFPEFRHRTVRICSFSKAFAMTGWRVGFLHTDRSLAARILRAHDALVTCAPVVSQYAALAALEHGEVLTARFREQFRQRRQKIIEHLDSMPSVFDYQTPQASYFAFPRIKDSVPLARDSTRLARRLLYEAKVAVVPGVAFGPTGEGHLRLCFARSEEDIDRAFERMREFFFGSHRHAGDRLHPPPAQRRAARARAAPLRHRFVARVLPVLSQVALRRRPFVVGVAGGRGKTVVKRALTQLLGLHWKVRSNPLSYNTEMGLALAVLGVATHGVPRWRAALRCLAALVRPPEEDILVLEFGTAAHGDMERLLRLVEPDLMVITPIAHPPAGDAAFVRTVLSEIDVLGQRFGAMGKRILACADDPALKALPSLAHAEWLGTDCFAGEPQSLKLSIGKWVLPIRRDWAGQTELYSLAVSVRVGQILGIPLEKAARFLAPPGRGLTTRTPAPWRKD